MSSLGSTSSSCVQACKSLPPLLPSKQGIARSSTGAQLTLASPFNIFAPAFGRQEKDDKTLYSFLFYCICYLRWVFFMRILLWVIWGVGFQVELVTWVTMNMHFMHKKKWPWSMPKYYYSGRNDCRVWIGLRFSSLLSFLWHDETNEGRA